VAVLVYTFALLRKNMPWPLKWICWIGGAVIALYTFFQAVEYFVDKYKQHGPGLHSAAHAWWSVSPWMSTLAISLSAGLVLALFSALLFYSWAKNPPDSLSDGAEPKKISNDVAVKSIPGTRFTEDQLEDMFPFGWILFTGRDGRWSFKEYPTDKMRWKSDWANIEIKPNFTTEMVEWTTQPITASRIVDGEEFFFLSGSGRLSSEHQMVIGKRFHLSPFRLVGELSNNPVPQTVYLGGSQREPVFALGFRIEPAAFITSKIDRISLGTPDPKSNVTFILLDVTATNEGAPSQIGNMAAYLTAKGGEKIKGKVLVIGDGVEFNGRRLSPEDNLAVKGAEKQLQNKSSISGLVLTVFEGLSQPHLQARGGVVELEMQDQYGMKLKCEKAF
jgi:hypothetical protein